MIPPEYFSKDRADFPFFMVCAVRTQSIPEEELPPDLAMWTKMVNELQVRVARALKELGFNQGLISIGRVRRAEEILEEFKDLLTLPANEHRERVKEEKRLDPESLEVELDDEEYQGE
jgi:hypothetical protein